MEIYLVRHTSVAVPPGIVYGQTDVPLKDSFEKEAEQVKTNLSGICFDKVWCSPLSRCVRLADYCGYADAIRDDRLKEVNFGEWEMQSWKDISADPRSKDWFADWIHTQTPGGESFMEQYRRVSAFLEDVRQSGIETGGVFAHGGVLTCARVHAGLYTLEEAFEHIPGYGEIIKLTLKKTI